MSSLPTVVLGRTGLRVTRLGYGSSDLQQSPSRPAMDAAGASTVLNTVLDLGINYLDTSPDYGAAEELIGTSIAHRREEFVLASKCGCVPNAGWTTPHSYSAANVRAGVEQSLRRLRTDHLDVVQFHFSPSPATFTAEGGLEELQRLRDAGKVRYLGMSGTLPHIWDQIAADVFDVFQIPYSGVEREHEDALTAAARAGAGTVVRGGVGRGVSVGDRAQAEAVTTPQYQAKIDDLRASDIWSVDMADRAERLRRAGLDDGLPGMGVLELMLRFTLSHPDVHTVIVGSRNPRHLQDNAEYACRGALTPELYADLKQRLPRDSLRPTS